MILNRSRTLVSNRRLADELADASRMWRFTGSLLVACLLASVPFTAPDAYAAKPAPDFQLPVLNSDKTQSLSQYRGMIVYVDFWASWCGPCRKSLPQLSKLRDELVEAGDFEVLAINVDAKTEDATRFLNQFPVSYPVLLDPKGKTPEAYGLVGMPTSYLIDHKGNIVSVHEGFRDGDIEKLRQEIEALRKAKK
ncbi:TlpA disulfide reductase family protein [Allohahella marinimesophila]|uniref:Thioredoxin domain-containing protein n=1 Tax=Allohahella marinimesophila TaxID=1054972 RepID=A0ABP7PAS6_9GAMM